MEDATEVCSKVEVTQQATSDCFQVHLCQIAPATDPVLPLGTLGTLCAMQRQMICWAKLSKVQHAGSPLMCIKIFNFDGILWAQWPEGDVCSMHGLATHSKGLGAISCR